jgi:hypothetical protein
MGDWLVATNLVMGDTAREPVYHAAPAPLAKIALISALPALVFHLC